MGAIELRNDRLGTLVESLTAQYLSAPSWEEFAEKFRGDSYLSKKVGQIEHPAAPLLDDWRIEGIPVKSTAPDWTDAK